MKLNNENIDELMFQLLEGEIRGDERTRLLEAIHADKGYSKQWQAWQKTVLNPNEELLLMHTGKLLKKDKKAIVLWWKYCAAAVVILAVGISVYFTNRPEAENVVKIEKPGNPKLQIIKVPSVEPVNPSYRTKDSGTSYRQRVQMMADKEKSDLPLKRIHVKESPMGIIDPKVEVRNAVEKTMVEVPETVIKNPAQVKEAPVIFTEKVQEESGVIMTVYSENISKHTTPTLNQKLSEKRNLLSRIFSMPKFKIVNDSNTYTNRKVILENKEYKIIAGF